MHYQIVVRSLFIKFETIMPTKKEYLKAKEIVIQYELLMSNYQKQLRL